MGEADQEGHGQHGGARPHVAPADPAQRAEQPEEHAPGLFGVGGGHHDERGERGEELHGRDPGQHDPVGGSAERVAEQQDEGERAQGPDEGTARDGHRSPADAQDDDHDRPGGRPRRDAEDEGVGERVAQQRLHHGAAHREPGSAHRGEQGAGHAQVPDDAVPDRGQPSFTQAEVRGHHGPDVRDGDACGADRHGHRDGQEQQGDPGAPQEAVTQDPCADGRARRRRRVRLRVRCGFGPRHSASPNERSPAATRSTPSTVRMVGFMAWPLSRT